MRKGIKLVLGVIYDLCPTVKIVEISRQYDAAAAWTYRNADKIGENPELISVSGHSADGYMTGMLLTEW